MDLAPIILFVYKHVNTEKNRFNRIVIHGDTLFVDFFCTDFAVCSYAVKSVTLQVDLFCCAERMQNLLNEKFGFVYEGCISFGIA